MNSAREFPEELRFVPERCQYGYLVEKYPGKHHRGNKEEHTLHNVIVGCNIGK